MSYFCKCTSIIPLYKNQHTPYAYQTSNFTHSYTYIYCWGYGMLVTMSRTNYNIHKHHLFIGYARHNISYFCKCTSIIPLYKNQHTPYAYQTSIFTHSYTYIYCLGYGMLVTMSRTN